MKHFISAFPVVEIGFQIDRSRVAPAMRVPQPPLRHPMTCQRLLPFCFLLAAGCIRPRDPAPTAVASADLAAATVQASATAPLPPAGR